MFIIIPLSLIGASILAIGIIVWRKLGYLRKLTPEAHGFSHTVFHDFFPELVVRIERIQIKEYLTLWLHELERFLRRVRLLFSKVDRMSDGMIKRIRSIHEKRVAQEAAKEAAAEEILEKTPEYVDIPTVQVKPRRNAPDPALLKAEEQHLIVQIAQHPKNAKLYRDLGDVYVRMKNFEDAKESFATALKLSPNDEIVQRKLADATQKLMLNIEPAASETTRS